MSDIPVYMIANFHIQDADTYKLYEKGFFPLLKKHGGSLGEVVDPLRNEYQADQLAAMADD